MILYCKDNLGCIDNNNIELINNVYYKIEKKGVLCLTPLSTIFQLYRGDTK
jgi:hypothetical protein